MHSLLLYIAIGVLKRGDKTDIDNAVLYAGGCPKDFHHQHAYKDSVKDCTALYFTVQKNHNFT